VRGTGNAVGGNPSGVQIPLPPPTTEYHSWRDRIGWPSARHSKCRRGQLLEGSNPSPSADDSGRASSGGLALRPGGMAERSKAAVLKIARPRKGSRGFESHSLRQETHVRCTEQHFGNFYTPEFVFVTLNVIVVLIGVVSSTLVLSSCILSVSIFSNSLSPFPKRTGITSICNSSHSPELRHC
jgi:hypothetical protein